jgi:hypothetical protein
VAVVPAKLTPVAPPACHVLRIIDGDAEVGNDRRRNAVAAYRDPNEQQ